jgi:heme exporter protein A
MASHAHSHHLDSEAAPSMTTAVIDAALLQAYLDSHYEVQFSAASVAFRVGMAVSLSGELLHREPLWTVITACNPGSRRLSDADNARRMAELDAELAASGLHAYPARNADAEGRWSEDSRFALAPDIAIIDALAQRFEQLAVVVGRGAVARLRCYADAPPNARMDMRFVDFVPCAAPLASAMNLNPDPEQPALLKVRNLAFERGEEPIFGAVGFDLANGGVVVIEGGNGAGKTSLLRVLAGLLPYAEQADDGPAPLLEVNGSVALLGHSLGLTGELDAMENLHFAAGLHGNGGGLQPSNALRSVGLEGYESVAVGRLSAGQRKRVALARLLVAPAAIWLLDEPYANLDPEGIGLVNRLIERHTHGGGGVVLTSHGAQLPLNQTATRVKL